jgi:AbiV family abortive infection protein
MAMAEVGAALGNRIRPVLLNARRLHQDAELLAKRKRFSSAYALALLSIEEIGKVLIDLWADESLWASEAVPQVKSRHFNFHIRKQVAFASLLVAAEVLGGRIACGGQMSSKEFKTLYARIFDAADGSGVLVEALFGVLNKNKEAALYADFEADLSAAGNANEAETLKLLERHSDTMRWLRDYPVVAFARLVNGHSLAAVAEAFDTIPTPSTAEPPSPGG